MVDDATRQQISDILKDIPSEERKQLLSEVQRDFKKTGLARHFAPGMAVWVCTRQPNNPGQFGAQKLTVFGLGGKGHALKLTDLEPDHPDYPKRPGPGHGKRKRKSKDLSDS